LEHWIGDQRVILLVRKWLKVGVLEDGNWSVGEKGTPQGAVVSPLLANVYLHYVFDLWDEQWRRRQAKGEMIFVRYADDLVVSFEHETDARRFWEALRQRFEQFGLELHGNKTRLLELGRYAHFVIYIDGRPCLPSVQFDDGSKGGDCSHRSGL
jgi:retron-type reverse transcriptase